MRPAGVAPAHERPAPVAGEEAAQPTYRVPVVGLLYAVVASPFLWMGHLALGPALAGYQCAHRTTWPTNALTILSVAPILLAMLVGWRIHRRARQAPAATSSTAVAFIALVGLGWSTISLYVTVLEGLPNAVGVASCPR